MVVGDTMQNWTAFYSQMRSSLDACFTPVYETLTSQTLATLYYADLRNFDRRDMRKYEEYINHVTHYTPCIQANPDANVSINHMHCI